MPRGGSRPGSGRKPKDKATATLHGSRSVVRFPSRPDVPAVRPDVPVAGVEMPEDLPEDAKLVWARLEPHALAAGTLTAGTVSAFALLCRQVVLEALLSRSPLDAGHASHRGMMQRVEAGYVRFALAPMGKPIAQQKKEVDPFAEFDEAAG